MGVHVVGTAVQGEGVSSAPKFGGKKHLFLELVEGYVKALEKSTSPLSTMREVFEHGAPGDKADGKRQKFDLTDMSFVRRGEQSSTRTK